MRVYSNIIFLLISFLGFSQDNSNSLGLEEYLGYVKKFHPIVKQAQLITSEGEAKLLKSRGAFDPKLEVDFANKKFKNSTYYDKLNATFKIPTWYGIELKANYENNEGTYLNPEFNTPEDGLYTAGISVSLAKGLLINKRMATLKQANLYTNQAEAKQKLIINEILFEAISGYFNWLKGYQEKLVFEGYLVNAENRLNIVRKSYLAGDKPAVDTLEASINLKNRKLDLEKASIKYIKSKLELSNYLWLEDNLPLELEQDIVPDANTINTIDLVLNSSVLNIENDDFIQNHPKIKELQFKQESLLIEKRLKLNNLLPKIDVEYNFLSTDYENINTFNTANYKSGLNISLPLFLRKERGDLALAKLKLKDIAFDISATEVSLKNKVNATVQEIDSYRKQYQILKNLVINYKQLVTSEERKFSLGEGSLFLINYREVKLIETELKRIDAEFNIFISKSNLSRVINNLY
ncbi:MAG: TolC family protein [Lutibacter sp.]|uniref:TolC family protein n=1 Tax=Lutibacter sp. TaxID=1925666 RepID=UPI0017B5F232|nr:TolC family protein [Lutibacter sp.]MBT8317829.1 TolC family protein [Lutibacter sp.]NNJ58687.1 TolC family protein [Lutibacter sp.]